MNRPVRPMPLEMAISGDLLIVDGQELLILDSSGTTFRVTDGTTETEFTFAQLKLLGATAAQARPLPEGAGAIVRDRRGVLWMRRHRSIVGAAAEDWCRVDDAGATCSGLLQQNVAEVVSEGTDVWQ